MVLFHLTSYTNCEDSCKKIISGLFLYHYCETDYNVLKSLLTNVLHWHIQLAEEKEIEKRDKFQVFGRVLLGLAKKIYDDHIEHIEGFNIEDVSDLVD